MDELDNQKLTLVARKPCFGLPTACPSCLPVYIYLRFAQVPFDLSFNLIHPDSGILNSNLLFLLNLKLDWVSWFPRFWSLCNFTCMWREMIIVLILVNSFEWSDFVCRRDCRFGSWFIFGECNWLIKLWVCAIFLLQGLSVFLAKNKEGEWWNLLKNQSLVYNVLDQFLGFQDFNFCVIWYACEERWSPFDSWLVFRNHL